MSQPYVGEIRMFGFGRAPNGWQLCDGSLMPIAEYATLYALIGTTYGGDGETMFAVPDLSGRAPVHQGKGAGLSDYVLGQRAGVEQVQLTQQQMPAHTHTLLATATGTRTATASGSLLGSGEADVFNRDAANPVNLSLAQIDVSGNSQPHENMQPSLCINFCIAWAGIFPSQG